MDKGERSGPSAHQSAGLGREARGQVQRSARAGSREIAKEIEEQTAILFHNVSTMLATCDLDDTLCDMPVWKHVYHMLHSCDRWFINPDRYEEPAFHTEGLNSLDVQSENALTKQALVDYFMAVREKVLCYIRGLSDSDLSGKPEGCPYTRMALILGQYRHLYAHMGNINGVTIMKTGEWPRVVGLDGDVSGNLYE